MLIVNITEVKRDFMKIIQSLDKNEDKGVIVNRRGKPVAVIIPYGEYVGINRIIDWLDMIKISEKMKNKGIKAKELYEISRRELIERWKL